MNNDLEQFSEERLKQMVKFCETSIHGLPKHFEASEVAALARIALAAKQAKPIGAMCEDGSAICFYDDRDVTVQKVMHWVACWPFSLYTTPQPAHTEQVVPEGLTETKLIKASAWIKCLRQQNPHMNEAKTCEEFINQLLASINLSKAAAPKPESE